MTLNSSPQSGSPGNEPHRHQRHDPPTSEGELNFLSLYYFLATPVEVRRAWLPILTKPAILKAMENGTGESRHV